MLQGKQCTTGGFGALEPLTEKEAFQLNDITPNPLLGDFGIFLTHGCKVTAVLQHCSGWNASKLLGSHCSALPCQKCRCSWLGYQLIINRRYFLHMERCFPSLVFHCPCACKPSAEPQSFPWLTPVSRLLYQISSDWKCVFSKGKTFPFCWLEVQSTGWLRLPVVINWRCSNHGNQLD